MKKLLFLLLPFAVYPALPAGRLLPSQVFAQSRLTYPIPDLGYCRDAKECYLYCEIPQNKAACWSYGKYKVGSDVLGVTTMSADEKRMMEEKARQYNVTFPIAELGNCAGPQECRDFCEESTNQTTCMDFAKKKGFHKEMERSDGMDAGKRDELLEKAKTELDCASMESCSRVCESDHSRCEAFARKHGVYQESPSSGRYSAEEKMQLMQKAQSELGCASMDSCKSICEQSPERCMEFAKKHGFDKGEDHGQPGNATPNYGMQRFGKGSCDSEESCKKYCEEHPNECSGFKGYTRATQGGYVGPSGCRTEAECKSWCETHPDQCPGFREAKSQEEASKREYELREQYQNYQPSQYNSYPDSQHYPSTTTQPAYNTTQPSSGSYTPPPATSSEGSGGSTLPAAP